MEVSIMHHVGIAFVLLWILSSFSCSHPLLYFASFVYLYKVNAGCVLKLKRRLQFKKTAQANQRRVLSDSETVRWLNHAAEKVWPICMEQIASQKILLPIIPWFLDKFKPWTIRKAVVQHMYLGRNPPVITRIRVLHQPADDDHLVLELGMNFLTAEDMITILDVQLNKRFGFGMWTKLHITGMHIEGKVLVGMKFLRHWPFIGRLRLCFIEAPYLQMTVKPIINRGLDVTQLPGIAGWIDKFLADAFEQTLIEPNMLVIDVDKFDSSTTEGWFSMDGKQPIAYVKVEIIEAADMKPSDLNGLADPYVKGRLGCHRFRTKTQKKTLEPKWQEEFKVPILTWELPNVLLLEVLDQDRFLDDRMGDCSVSINNLRGGQRHDKWLPLRNIKMGRLHLAVTVLDHGKELEHLSNKELSNKEENRKSMASEGAQQDSNQSVALEEPPKLVDELEPVNITAHQQAGVWVCRPGNDVSPTWETRTREGKRPTIRICREENVHRDSPGSIAIRPPHNHSSNDENLEGNGLGSPGTLLKGQQKIGSIFQRSPRNQNPNNMKEFGPIPLVKIQAISKKGISVKVKLDGDNYGDQRADKGTIVCESEAEKSRKGHMSSRGKSILTQVGRSACSIKHALSRMHKNKNKASLVNKSRDKECTPSSKKSPPPPPPPPPRNEGTAIESSPSIDNLN